MLTLIGLRLRTSQDGILRRKGTHTKHAEEDQRALTPQSSSGQRIAIRRPRTGTDSSLVTFFSSLFSLQERRCGSVELFCIYRAL